MISHQYKCIFIHIPRTGGTSVELTLTHTDWGLSHKPEKHIFASHAKKLYAQYWDDYFKFSIVRNPYDRLISLYLWSHVTRTTLNLLHLIQEEATRSMCHYLDEPLDAIIRHENLSNEYQEIAQIINGPMLLGWKRKNRNHPPYATYYDRQSMNMVNNLYRGDFDRFGYQKLARIPLL